MTEPSVPRRKTVRHFDAPGDCHELTCSCYQRRPLLQLPGVIPLLAEAVDRATEGQGFDLLAFVFMPEHVHLLVYPTQTVAKVADLLIQPQRQIEQQAFEAAQSGRFLTPPSPDAIRAEQAQQDQQLRSALGEAGFAAFNQYRATLPDRIMISAMNEQGANLSDSQAQQLLQVMTEARQQVIDQSGITQYASSISPDQTMTAL